MRVPEALTLPGAAYTSDQVLRLPSPVPRWLDLRRLLFLGYVTVDTPGYIAVAKVHYRASHWGIAGSRVHDVTIWRDTGKEFTVESALYRHFRGNVIDHLDADGRCFLNLIVEYFK